ncbi:MAG TPA: hypothetical protein PK530_25370, partial [Anaerolineales bacterium]|nr:hypothetical protein [Anaerolineales bacterium]
MTLPQRFAQALAITRYELLMNWRQRAIPVLTLSLIALPIFFALFFNSEMTKGADLYTLISPKSDETYARSITSFAQLFAWASIYLILLVMAPLIMSPIIPKDRQFGVRELLDGLPISPATYLNGKLLGAWLAVFIGMVFAMGIVSLGWRLIFEAIYLPSMISVWFVGGSAMLILNTGLAILLAAGQSTRKGALVVTTGFIFICLFFHIGANLNFENVSQIASWELFTPAHNPLYHYYVFANMAHILAYPVGTPTIPAIRAWQTFFVGFA